MWSAATVLACVLDLLGRSTASLPPIVLADTRPRNVTERAEAFVRIGDPTIYLLTSSAVFRAAQRSPEKCGAFHALRKLASIVVHEEWHVRHGADERGAYAAQLAALTRLSAGPGTPAYTDVNQAMHAAVKRQSQVLRSVQDVPARRPASTVDERMARAGT